MKGGASDAAAYVEHAGAWLQRRAEAIAQIFGRGRAPRADVPFAKDHFIAQDPRAAILAVVVEFRSCGRSRLRRCHEASQFKCRAIHPGTIAMELGWIS